MKSIKKKKKKKKSSKLIERKKLDLGMEDSGKKRKSMECLQ